MLQRWYSSVNRALERREKETLTTHDVKYAKDFSKKPLAMLQTDGMKLKLEAIAKVDYIVIMSKLNENLPNKIYKIPRCGVAPGMSVFFQQGGGVV